jgi:tetratricopeptide (TPR) repeat protein
MKSKLFALAVFSVILVMLAAQLATAQTTAEETPEEKPAIYWLYDNMYRMATKYNDYQTAATALYSLITLDPQNDSLRFNLAYIYFDGQKYPSAVLASMDVLQINPNHTGALEISGYSYETLGIKDKALSNFEKLFIITENVETLYKMAFLQYDLKRYAECTTNVDILLSKPEIDEITMSFQISDTEQKSYGLRVATLNLKGLVNTALGDIDGARKAYNEALALAPDFIFAKNNLDELDK